MILTSTSFSDQQPIPPRCAFGDMDPETHVALSDNLNPQLRWSDVPVGTRSFVLICHDPDVPSVGDDVNQEGKTIPSDLPRVDFFHWVLADIPADRDAIEEGEFCSGITPGGKSGPDSHGGMRQGLNNYTDWFSGDPDMGGDYFGYDGPCPPWNDSIVHHYVFTLFALDIERAPIEGVFDGPALLESIREHVLDKAQLTGTYTLTPGLAE